MPKQKRETTIKLNLAIPSKKDFKEAIERYKEKFPENEYKYKKEHKKFWYEIEDDNTGIILKNNEPYPLKMIFTLALKPVHFKTNVISRPLKNLGYKIGKITRKDGKWYLDGKMLSSLKKEK